MSTSMRPRMAGKAAMIRLFLLALLLCVPGPGARAADSAQQAGGQASSYSGTYAPQPAQPQAQDSRNYAPGYNGFAGTWRDPENGDIVTSVIAPRPQPSPQESMPMIIEPQIAPGIGGNGQSWPSGQQGGVYYVGPGKAYEVPGFPGPGIPGPGMGWTNGPASAPPPGYRPPQRPWGPGWNGAGQNWPQRPGNIPGGGWGGAPGRPMPPQGSNGWLPPPSGNGAGHRPWQPAPGWNGAGHGQPGALVPPHAWRGR